MREVSKVYNLVVVDRDKWAVGGEGPEGRSWWLLLARNKAVV